jgi:hypothetical protein
MLSRHRQHRVQVLEALERRARPLDLDGIAREALAGEDGSVGIDALRTRGVLRLEWAAGDVWDLSAVTLPSGLHLYCDSDGRETRVLASAKRGTPSDADGFFLERLAESRGHLFGIEMAGAPPDRVRSAIGDREFLADVFVELLEGSDAEFRLKAEATGDTGDFRSVIVRWLERVLSAPPMTRRQPRVRDEDPSL